MVWLGIDLGDARVGLALSDPELTLAHPIGNIQVYGDYFHALDEVIDVIGDELVDHVVIGLPVALADVIQALIVLSVLIVDAAVHRGEA